MPARGWKGLATLVSTVVMALHEVPFQFATLILLELSVTARSSSVLKFFGLGLSWNIDGVPPTAAMAVADGHVVPLHVAYLGVDTPAAPQTTMPWPACV